MKSVGTIILVFFLLIMFGTSVFAMAFAPTFIGAHTGENSASGSRASAEGRNPTENGSELPPGQIPPSCNGVIAVATQYIGQRIYYSQKSPRCGGGGTGVEQMLRNEINWLDCSGFVSRAYRDAGLLRNCYNTAGLGGNASLVNIVAGDVDRAKELAQPGDIILRGMKGDPDNPSKIEGRAHALLYVGNGQAAIDSTTTSSRTGPGYNPRVWNNFFGLYRATSCSGNQ